MALRGANFRFTATNAATPAMKNVQTGLRSIQRETIRTQAVGRSWNRGLSQNRRAVQQLGFQMTDFGVQIAGGQNAMLAFVQQGGQMLQVFGPAGAVMAAFVTVFGTLAIVLGKTGKSLADIFPLMGVLQEEFRSLGTVLSFIKELFLDFANVLVNNLDTIIITLAIVVGWFATKWVSGMIAASGAAQAFTASMIASNAMLRANVAISQAVIAHQWLAAQSLIVYRNAIVATSAASLVWIRSLFTVGSAMTVLRTASLLPLMEMLTRFTATAVVSFGTVVVRAIAMSQVMLINVVTSFASMTAAAFASVGAINATTIAMAVSRAGALALTGASVALRLVTLAYSATTVAATAAQASFNVAMAVGRGAVVALTTVVRGLTVALAATGIGAVVIVAGFLIERFFRLVQVTGSFGEAVSLLKDIVVAAFKAIPDFVRAGSLEMAAFFVENVAEMLFTFNQFGQTVADGLNSLFHTNLKFKAGFQAATDLTKLANNMRAAAASAIASSTSIADLTTKVEALRDLLREDQIDVRDWLGVGGGGGGGGASPSDRTKTEVDKITKQFLDMRDTISGALLDTFRGLVKGTKDAGDIISDILGKIFDKISDILLTPIFDKFSGGLSSILFKGLGIPTISSFAGGGSTGSGPRVGGMDGRGGRLAMIHPQESVVDHTRGGSAGGGTVVNVYNYSQGGVRQERGMGPDGTEFIDVIVEDSMSVGRYDSAQRSRYGNRPIPVRR